ncbi:unnamed protein product [Bursaphelenchus okinawaensis]|uniref:Galectin n=1 Tax=Bursaphelenchus okinawaensis TaxID=465554 RepID=A0A811KR45_9BILA|nr:unnamed protein product [Bursaphelenchus okinawaensis]CAG9109334.1 unnamed protein product [Bursaphelenchus okinawaensis]
MSLGKVYVGGLPEDATNEELEEAFHKFGRIRKIWVARRPPGFAFVEFDDQRDAEDAVRALDGSRLCGVKARVELSNGRSRGGGGDRRNDRGGRYDRDRRDRYRSRSPRDRRRSRSPRRERSPRRSESPRRSRTRSKSPEGRRSVSKSSNDYLKYEPRSPVDPGSKILYFGLCATLHIDVSNTADSSLVLIDSEYVDGDIMQLAVSGLGLKPNVGYVSKDQSCEVVIQYTNETLLSVWVNGIQQLPVSAPISFELDKPMTWGTMIDFYLIPLKDFTIKFLNKGGDIVLHLNIIIDNEGYVKLNSREHGWQSEDDKWQSEKQWCEEVPCIFYSRPTSLIVYCHESHKTFEVIVDSNKIGYYKCKFDDREIVKIEITGDVDVVNSFILEKIEKAEE